MEILGILVFGVVVFSIGMVGGVIMVKIFNKFFKEDINLLIGVVGVFVVFMVV